MTQAMATLVGADPKSSDPQLVARRFRQPGRRLSLPGEGGTPRALLRSYRIQLGNKRRQGIMPAMAEKLEQTTNEDLEAFAAALEALGREARAQLGQDEVRSLRSLKRLSHWAELVGRLGLQCSSHPLVFCPSVTMLILHLGLEAQLNHSIQHGIYTRLKGAEDLARDQYETLALPLQTKTWREAHRIHHANPSLLGLDPDTVHPLFRVHPDRPWRWWNLFNTFLGAVLVFECWGNDYDKFLKEQGHRAEEDKSEKKKLLSFLSYQFLLFPVLAGERARSVFFGNLIAVLLRNLIFVALQTGSSVGENVSTLHAQQAGPKSKGKWYRFQVETSKNYKAPWLWTLLSGGLDRHIEHHLYPTLPALKLREISPKVRELCARYGVRYEEHESPWASLRDSLRHLFRLSLPPQPKS
jgi:NADPH-dependent stearoyl-CoA 9-desaturase